MTAIRFGALSIVIVVSGCAQPPKTPDSPVQKPQDNMVTVSVVEVASVGSAQKARLKAGADKGATGEVELGVVGDIGGNQQFSKNWQIQQLDARIFEMASRNPSDYVVFFSNTGWSIRSRSGVDAKNRVETQADRLLRAALNWTNSDPATTKDLQKDQINNRAFYFLPPPHLPNSGQASDFELLGSVRKMSVEELKSKLPATGQFHDRYSTRYWRGQNALDEYSFIALRIFNRDQVASLTTAGMSDLRIPPDGFDTRNPAVLFQGMVQEYIDKVAKGAPVTKLTATDNETGTMVMVASRVLGQSNVFDVIVVRPTKDGFVTVVAAHHLDEPAAVDVDKWLTSLRLVAT